MSITTVELCHRIGRRARGGDFTALSMSEQTDIMQAATSALQRLYNALPTYFKEQTQGFVLPAPLAITGVVATQYSKTVTGYVFTASQFGRSVVLDGDSAWNQIIGTGELLNPYMGTTGTVAGTIYGNAMFSTTYPLDRMIGDPRFADAALLPISRSINPPGIVNNPWLLQQATGLPQTWWPQVFGNSQGNTPLMAIRFAPAPDQAYAVNVRLAFWPKRLTLADYDSNTALSVPDQFIEPSLIPMAIQDFITSPAFQSRNDELLLENRGIRGEAFAKNQPGQIGTPHNRSFTPAGF